MTKLTRTRRARLERGLKQGVLAQMAGISQPLLSTIESGRFIPGPKLTERLAKALNVPAEWLVEP